MTISPRHLLISFLTLIMVPVATPAQEEAAMERKAEDLLRRMTLEEKISLLSGTGFETRAIPRLGIPPLNMTDGPVGVRFHKSTAFPASIALAASWDPALASRYAQAIAVEAKAEGRRMLLGPCVNINRVPHAGRNFESFGEDPFLTSRLAVDYVRGVQSERVVACTKHYAANNQEWQRDSISVEVDERTLREIYFPAFKAAVQEGGSRAVMSAYNKINRTWCSENSFLLNDVLKKEWGFRGIVVSDWGAVHSTIPTANAGLDVEMPDGKYLGGGLLLDAVKRGDVKESVVDDKVIRILRVIGWTGLFDDPQTPDPSAINSAAHKNLAREIAAAGTVLLKNSGQLLPVNLAEIHSIAVIGPNAATARPGGGGSSQVVPFSSVSPLEGITARGGKTLRVRYAQGCVVPGDIQPVEASVLRPPGGPTGIQGLRGEYFANQNFEGKPALVRVDPQLNFDWGDSFPAPELPKDHFSVRWTGTIVPPETAEYELSIRSDDGSRLYLNGALLIGNWGDHAGETRTQRVTMEKGKPYDLRIDYYENGGGAIMQFGWQTSVDRWLTDAVDAAKQSDLALVIVGTSGNIESEGFDRTSLDLPLGQNALIEAVLNANPRTVVVLTTGAPVLMPWVDAVPAIVQAWFGGEQAGPALADILFGDVNPAGKLPVTFLKAWKDSPAFATYPGDGKTFYSEGIFVGYRHFDKNNIIPLFPFGHGLSYTTFSYAHLAVTPRVTDGKRACDVSMELTNTGTRRGAEVVQFYVTEDRPSVPRPPKELKGFRKIDLAPGEKGTVTLSLDESAFSFFDPAARRWTMNPGTFTIHAGSSSRDLRATGTVTFR